MPKKSSSFVKVFFADKDKVLCQLKEYVRRLKSQRSEVEKVGLFGSYATDSYGPASDADLFIVLSHSDKRFVDRIPEFVPDNLTIGCDVFPYTEEEITKMKDDGNHWIRHVLKEVVWL
jgi:predicted nucleotidyltransferase